jgi:hypothetical protein
VLQHFRRIAHRDAVAHEREPGLDQHQIGQVDEITAVVAEEPVAQVASSLLDENGNWDR